MKKHVFTHTQRYALWKFYDRRCILCDQPLSLSETTGDHVIPEHLAEKPDDLATVLADFGITDAFDLNDYCNWIPAHIRCNQKKGKSIFKPAPLIQTLLERLQRDAEKVRAIEIRVLNRADKEELLGKVMAAIVAGKITQDDLESLFPADSLADDEDVLTLYDEACLHIDSHRWRIIRRDGKIATVSDGKYFGMTPISESPDLIWLCPSCKSFGPWNGIRCMSCGRISDPND